MQTHKHTRQIRSNMLFKSNVKCNDSIQSTLLNKSSHSAVSWSQGIVCRFIIMSMAEICIISTNLIRIQLQDIFDSSFSNSFFAAQQLSHGSEHLIYFELVIRRRKKNGLNNLLWSIIIIEPSSGWKEGKKRLLSKKFFF